MTRPHPSLARRIALALGSFFAILANPAFAARVAALRNDDAPAATPPLREPPAEAALQLLGLLQREARLVDFVEEDIAAFPDADVGAAARIVHEGCRKVLREHFELQPVREEAEGARITLPAGFDAATIRLTGKVAGEPPFTGSLCHRGWKVAQTRLPRLAAGHDASIVAQAEVEL